MTTETAPLISGHVYRPLASAAARLRGLSGVPRRELPCEYMNCRRPRTEHARSVS